MFPQQPPQPDDQHANVRIEIRNDLIEVAPGNAESTPFTIKNLGTQVEEFHFILNGPEWITVDPAAISVFPGDEATGTVQAAPPRNASSVAGVTPFRLTVTSALNVHNSSSAAGRVDVAPYYELAAELVPTSSNGRGFTHHHITLDNRGNVPLRIALNPTDVADGLRLSVPAVAELAPGRVAEVPMSVYGSRRWIGRPEPKTFSVIAEPPKPLAPTRLSGTRIVAPLFPRWVPAAAAGLVAVAVAAAVVVPKLAAHNVPSQPHSPSPSSTSQSSASPSTSQSSASPSTSQSSASPSTSQSSASPSTSQSSASPSTSQSSASPSTPAVPSVDLISQAPNAPWTSLSPLGPQTTPVQQNTGCQLNAVTSASQGAVFSLQQVALEDDTKASTALETDPPGRRSASITGVYTLSPTAAGEVFRADVGFCQGVAAGAQMQYQVVVGSQSSTGPDSCCQHQQLTPVEVDLPAGTTQITLRVSTPRGPNGDVVWVNPRIEAANAPSPPARPTV